MWPAVIRRLSAMLLNVLCQLRTWQPVASQARWEALAALLMLAHTGRHLGPHWFPVWFPVWMTGFFLPASQLLALRRQR